MYSAEWAAVCRLLRLRPNWPVMLAAVFIAIAGANLAAGSSLPINLVFALANVVESALEAWALLCFLASAGGEAREAEGG